MNALFSADKSRSRLRFLILAVAITDFFVFIQSKNIREYTFLDYPKQVPVVYDQSISNRSETEICRKIFYFHVPKTAGSSMINYLRLLEKILKADFVLQLLSKKDMVKFVRKELTLSASSAKSTIMRLHTSSIPFSEFKELYPPLKKHYTNIGCKSFVFTTLREPVSHRLSSIKYCKQAKCLHKYARERKTKLVNDYNFVKLNKFAPHNLQYLFLTVGCDDVLCSNVAAKSSTQSRSINVRTVLQSLRKHVDLVCMTDKFGECVSLATKFIDLTYCGYSNSNLLRDKVKVRDAERLLNSLSVDDYSDDMYLYKELSKIYTTLTKSICKTSCPVCRQHNSRAELYSDARERGFMKR